MPSMLTGRESLIRLIGKRRRTVSPHLLQLIDSQEIADPSPKLNINTDQSCDSEWVTCPVCAKSIRGTDNSVNNHLDTCLIRGTKRKLTQSTLRQFSFCPTSVTSTSLNDPTNVKEDFRKELDDVNNAKHTAILDKCSARNGEGKYYRANSSVYIMRNYDKCVEDPIQDSVVGDALCCKVAEPTNALLSAENMKMIMPAALGEKDADAMIMLETLIVGRRFHENIVLQQGSHISLSRDPQNPKDSNAIKVIYADTGHEVMLGYLSRELAQYLSPLLANQYVKCEGSVVSVPKHHLDNVPVQLACQWIIGCGELDDSDRQDVEFMWKNVLRVIGDTNACPSNMTKYQKNFHVMIDDVMKHDDHLFTDEEKSSLGYFKSLSDDAQRLFVRLYTRKGPWFRSSNIFYQEISDLQNAIEDLRLAGYICSFHSPEDPFEYNMKEILGVLTVCELREIYNLKFYKNGMNNARRQELVDFLVSAYEDGTCSMLPAMVLQRAGSCIKITSTVDTLLWRVQRLFFLNSDQDLSAFLLIDVGLIKFPTYTCNISRPVFQDRDYLLDYEEAVQVAQVMDQSLDDNNMEMVIKCIGISDIRMLDHLNRQSLSSISDLPATFFSCFSASWVYSKVLTLGVSVYESERRYRDAISLLKELLRRMSNDRRRGYWILRLSVNLEHIGYLNESLSVAEEGVLDPWARSGSKVALQRRVLRLSKPPRRWKTPSYAESIKRKIKEVNIAGRPLNCELGAKNIFYGYDGKQCGVEQLALQYYAEEGGGWQGVHSESGIWMTIFGLLMWDVMFSDVPDVFRSRFQTAPLDLNTDDFYVSRKCQIECQLQKIRKGFSEEILITSWERHNGTTCKGVNWDRHSLTELRAAVSCIGGPCIASLCRQLAQDYRSWSSGMPDLLLWRFHGGETDGGEAMLVEVKGPRDKLSEQQRAWLLVLMDCGFDTEVCKVSSIPKP